MKETVLTSTILILAILIVRRLFQNKVSRKLIYGIWLLVVLRLLVPVQFGNFDFSILKPVAPVERVLTEISDNPVAGPSQEEVYSQIVQNYIQQDTSAFVPEVQKQIQSAVDSGAQTPAEIYDSISKEYSAQSMLTPEAKTMAEAAVEAASAAPTVGDILTIVWLTGMVFMAVWFLAVNLKHNKQIREVATPLTSVRGPIPVMVSPLVDSPCLAGLFHPVIYLTPDCAADRAIRRHVLVHELTHYKNKDHIWAFVRCVCLCVYWFHPLVWVAALVSNRDCELACDEGALKRLGSEERINYGRTLLRVVSRAASPTALLHTATSMNESKKQLTERVNYIVKKPKVWISAAVCTVLACAIATGCAFAGAPEITEITEPIVSVENLSETDKVTPEGSQGTLANTAPIKDSFLPLGNSGNFFYVPSKTMETSDGCVYPLGENLLHLDLDTLTLVDTQTGEVAALKKYEHPVNVQVVADYAVIFDNASGMIDIFDGTMNYIKSYLIPSLDTSIWHWYLGADLETFYYFEGDLGLQADIRAINLKTGAETTVLANLTQFDLVNWYMPDGFLFSYYDPAANADMVAHLDLITGAVTPAPVDGIYGMQSTKTGDVWLLEGDYDPEDMSKEYLLFTKNNRTTLRKSEVRLVESQKQVVIFSDFDTMALYDLEGYFISSCDTSAANTTLSDATFVWNERLNGYFIYGASYYGNHRLYFWDLSVPA